MSSAGWRYIDATAFCTKVTDGTHDSPKRKEFGKPLITSKHIKGRSIDFESAYFISDEDSKKINLRSKVDQWDVIISMIGEYCGFCYVERNPIIDYVVKNVGIFKTGNKIKADWLYYYLNSPEGKNSLASLKSGTSQPYLSLGALRSLPILIPGTEREMEKIISLLSALDEKIEFNRQTNATLEAIAQTIFKEWFVDFNFPGSTGEMVESELGMIPRGWRVEKLESISEKITKGTTPTTLGDKFVDGGIRFLRAECIQDDFGIDVTKSLFIASETHNKLKRSQLSENDILVTIAGSIGRMGIITKRILPANLNQAIGIIRLDPKNIPMTYVYYYLKQQTVRNELLSGITQSVQANISLTDLNNIKILIPSKNLLEKFSAITKINREYIENLIEQSANISALRDGLLPKLISGEIEV